MNNFRFYEFFAGGGMARLGLGERWQCEFANDFDPVKSNAYRENWGGQHFCEADINSLRTVDLPGAADLAWASFPCQDLSLAGNARGIGTADNQTRSGAFWAFWRLMNGLVAEERAPACIVLENVYGSLTANGGYDFALICRSLALASYRFGAVMLDAAAFLPQSRPRVFIIAFRADVEIPDTLMASNRSEGLHPLAMERAVSRLSDVDQLNWIWWRLPLPQNAIPLHQLIDFSGREMEWHSEGETRRLIAMMSPLNAEKLRAMIASGLPQVGTIYKRTRVENGVRVQRAELRTDGIAGCLRTPGGGSSRQILMFVEKHCVRSRLLSSREAARLMGLPDSYILPTRYNDAYHLAGDGVAVPVVKHLAQEIVEPVLCFNMSKKLKQAA